MLPSLVLAALLAQPTIDPAIEPEKVVQEINNDQVWSCPIGVASSGSTVEAIIHSEDLELSTAKTRVLLVGDSSWASRSIGDALVWFYGSEGAAEFRKQFVLSAVPSVHQGQVRPASTDYPPP